MKKSRPPPRRANMGQVGRQTGQICWTFKRNPLGRAAEDLRGHLKSRELRCCPAAGEWTKLLKWITKVCILKVGVYMTIYTLMWFIWVCYFRFALSHNRYGLSLCLMLVTDGTDVCLRWSNEMSGGGSARSLQRFNEPGELSASAGGAVDALLGAV